MTSQRVFWIVVAVLIGAAAAWLRNWWTFSAMVIVVIGQLAQAWKAQRAQKAPTADEGRTDPVAGPDAD